VHDARRGLIGLSLLPRLEVSWHAVPQSQADRSFTTPESRSVIAVLVVACRPAIAGCSVFSQRVCTHPSHMGDGYSITCESPCVDTLAKRVTRNTLIPFIPFAHVRSCSLGAAVCALLSCFLVWSHALGLPITHIGFTFSLSMSL
jgi:hypothetical protein